jgi:tRNA-modifying protein YgfZ
MAVDTFWVQVPRDIVMVEGADALTYLHSQLSQDLRPLAVGQSTVSLVLEPNGKVHSLVRVLRSGDHAFVLDVDHGYGEALVSRLNRFRIRVQAEITTIPWRCVAVRGPDALAAVGSAAGAVVVPAWWGDGSAVDLLGPAPVPPAGAAAGTLDDLEAARVRAGWPAMGHEITEASIPAELGVNGVAVSFTKGCYPGQELVERMDSRGSTAPRSLRRLPADDQWQPGDPVVVDGVEVGQVTSVAGDWALALVKRGVEMGAPVQAPSSD